MYGAILMLILSTRMLPVIAENFEIGTNTVLVYQTKAGEQQQQFVLRIARFKPDIVLEWESYSHQGTVHLFRSAVENSSQYSVNELFDVGVDTETGKETTKWLSKKMYENLMTKGKAKIKLNRITADFQLKEESTRQLLVNKVETNVPVIVLTDNRNGVWAFLKSSENPILIEYETPYYHENLARVSTDEANQLRWIKKLPPVQ